MNISRTAMMLVIVVGIVFISGNQNPIYAGDEDKKISESDVESLCGASEDYEAHKE